MARELIVPTRDFGGPPQTWHVYQSGQFVPEHLQWVATVETPSFLTVEEALRWLYSFCQNRDAGRWPEPLNWVDRGPVASSNGLEGARSLMIGDVLVPNGWERIAYQVEATGFRMHFID